MALALMASRPQSRPLDSWTYGALIPGVTVTSFESQVQRSSVNSERDKAIKQAATYLADWTQRGRKMGPSSFRVEVD